MKHFAKAVLTIVLSLMLVSGIGTRTALGDDSENQIIVNCRAAQSTLNAIEKADTVARVNLGRNYADMLNLMFAGNARLSANHIAAASTADITSQFSGALNIFKTDFDNYDDSLSSVISINCQSNPVGFYENLVETRDQRNKLHADVANLNQLMNSYLNAWHTATGGTK